MLMIGCDFHPSFQEVAMLDNETGEIRRKRVHHPEQAREFYAALAQPVRVGMEACEHSSGGRQRLGHVSKQGSPLMRFLLVEAGQTAARIELGLRRRYLRWSLKIGRSKAKVAVARTLAMRVVLDAAYRKNVCAVGVGSLCR